MQPFSLRGYRLLAARVAWMVLTALAVGICVAAILDAYLNYPSTCAECRPFWQIAPKDVTALRDMRLSVDFYIAYGLVMEAIYWLGFLAIGVVIFWRKGNDQLGLLFSLVLVLFGTLEVTNLSIGIHPALTTLGDLLSFVTYLAFFASLYIFPDGHFVPRWTRWMVAAWAIYIAVLLFSSEDSPLYPASWPLLLNMIVAVGLFGSIVFAQVYRYRRVSEQSERQQTKWVVFGITSAIFGTFIASLPAVVFGEVLQPGVENIIYALFELTVTNLSLLIVPFAIGVAILRFRLWDIDIIINRTLVYGTLTAILAGVYFGGVTATQATFRALTSQEQQAQVTVVISTLVIAALFTPLRRRIQAFIDRRFYRRKYDARKTLEAFSSKLRDETDLKALNKDLVGVVAETMQPAHISLWLRPDRGPKSGSANRDMSG